MWSNRKKTWTARFDVNIRRRVNSCIMLELLTGNWLSEVPFYVNDHESRRITHFIRACHRVFVRFGSFPWYQLMISNFLSPERVIFRNVLSYAETDLSIKVEKNGIFTILQRITNLSASPAKRNFKNYICSSMNSSTVNPKYGLELWSTLLKDPHKPPFIFCAMLFK